jgi:hypothetical protein
LRNGKLLAAAATEFDVFLMIDKNLKHQQNLATLPLAVIVILAKTNRLTNIVPFVPEVERRLISIQSYTLVEVSIPLL